MTLRVILNLSQRLKPRARSSFAADLKISVMKHLFYFLTILTTLFLHACSIGLKPVADSVELELEDALTRGLDGIVVCVHKEGVNDLYSAGWNNRENQVPSDPEAYFKIASISKLYIAAATAKLVAAEQLTLDKSLAEYLPELADRIEYADEITLKMMVQHRSGIPNYSDDPDYPWATPPQSNDEALAFALDKPAEFKPNKKYRYSNTNYLLIGEILDKTLGYSHHEFIQTELLDRLDLHHTHSLMKDVDIDSVTSGYAVGYEYDIKYNDFTQPGGSMVATAGDVAIFLRALIDGSLFDGDEAEIYASIYVYEHTGLVPGYCSIAKYHEALDAVVVQFVNTSGEDTWFKTEKVYNRVIRILEKEAK
jgi:D-alanyl-D-alanine carboxypeptidase